MDKIKVTVIGGGTGSLAVLRGLKIYPDLDVKVIVNMTDDGGSNITVRDEFGLLPLSDIRKSIIALSDEDKNMLLRQLFTYRFSRGESFSGHTLGNIIMMALSDIAGSEVGAIQMISNLFGIKGEVIPVTLDQVRVCAKYTDGSETIGEHLIDETLDKNDCRIDKLFLSPRAHAYKRAIEGIHNSDYIIIGPGDLYTTTIANLIVEGIASAIKKSGAKIIYISNLMTKSGQTHWMKASDHVKELEKYTNTKPDTVIINNGVINSKALERYTQKGENIIEDDLDRSVTRFKTIRANIVADDEIKLDKGDKLVRSYIRHDPYKLGYLLYGIMHGYD